MTVIRIQECSEQAGIFQAKVSFNQGPEYAITVRNPFSKEEEECLEWYFEEHLKFPFTNQVKAQEAAASVITYGENLFAQVFASEPHILVAYETAAKVGLNPLQIEVVGQPSFHAFHWEALKDLKAIQPLALQATIVRKNVGSQILPVTVPPSPTINLLIVTARPRGKLDIGYRTISRPLVDSLRQDKLSVNIDIVRPGTYKALENHLRVMTEQHGVGYYHVVHFDVHGSVLSYPHIRHLLGKRYGRDKLQPYTEAKAFLFFEREKDNGADPLEASELAKLLKTYQIPIAILNACQSGKQVGEQEPNLGSYLVQEGVQLVLAMSYSVTVTAAELLMRTLYQQIFAGSDLSLAIRTARSELYQCKGRQAYYNQTIDLEDWLLPVLYENQPQRLMPRPFTPSEKALFRGKEAERYRPTVPTYGFVGRDLDILQIEKLLLTRRNLLLIRGMGGVGKTTLLQHLADWWQRTGFIKQVFYFGYDEKAYTQQQILDTIARRLMNKAEYIDFQPLLPEAQLAKLSQMLCAHRHLLILDNLESITGTNLAIPHTLPAEEQRVLQSLLATLVGGQTLVLLGSRAEEAWLSPGTFAENVYDLAGLDAEAASILADRILERYKATRYRKDENLPRLLKLLAGFPLALEVVLTNLAHQTPAEVFAALQAGDVKIDPKSNTQERTKSILLCIDYSHSNLSPEAQQLLLCLAPFASVFDTDMLELYTHHLGQQPTLNTLPLERLSEAIHEAENWGLLSADPDNPNFVHLQPTFPYFLRNRLQTLEQAEVWQSIETAFRQYYGERGITLKEMLESKDQQEQEQGQNRIRLEYENLITALNLALDAEVSIHNIYDAIFQYLEATENRDQGLKLGEAVLKRLEAYPSEKMVGRIYLDLTEVTDSIARWYLKLKQYEKAEALYQRTLDLLFKYKGFNSELSEAEIAGKLTAIYYNRLGRAAEGQKHWFKAEQYYLQALQNEEKYIDVRDGMTYARIYHHLGNVKLGQREWTQAETYYQKALQIYKTLIGHTALIEQARTYDCLGLVSYEQGNWSKAEQHYLQTLYIYRQLNTRYEQAQSYLYLGVLTQKQGQWAKAEQYYQQALQIDIEYNNRYRQGQIYHNLGKVVMELGQWVQAEQYYQRALQIYIEYHDRYEQARTHAELGVLAMEQQQWAMAEQYLQQALQVEIEYNDHYNQAKTYRFLGMVVQEQQQWAKAEQYLQQALQVKLERSDQREYAHTYWILGNLEKEQGHWPKAEQYYQRALQIYAENHDHFNEASMYGELGFIAYKQKQWMTARDHYLQALKFFLEDEDDRAISLKLLDLAQLWQASGDKGLPVIIASALKTTPRNVEQLLHQMLQKTEERNE
jgi:tetratricopeptide (TPR) repeat protein